MNEVLNPANPITLVDLINRLSEPPQPAAVSMFPQTVGWTVLAVVALTALTWLALRRYRSWRANAYRRVALAELEASGDDPVKIAGILRRVALVAWPREEVASLIGVDWLDFLDNTGGNGSFRHGPGKALLKAPYQPIPKHPGPGLQTLAKNWVEHHSPQAGGN